MSGEKPVFDDPEAVAGVKDAFRSKFGREPTRAEFDAEVERLRQFKLTKPEPPQRPSITVDELAAKAKEFWDTQLGPPEEPHTPNPGEMRILAESERIVAAHDPDNQVLKKRGVDAARAAAAVDSAATTAVSNSQSSRARKKRPKKKPTHKSEVISGMRTYRTDNRTLSDFLAAAEVGSIPGVSIKRAPLGEGNTYIVDCEDASDDAKTLSFETIKGWWQEAAKTI